MYRKILACAAMSCAFAGMGAISASAAMTPAVASVAQRAASLPAPTTPALAQQDQAALQPAVDQAVKDGTAAVTALLAIGNPAIASDLVKDATVTQTTTNINPTGAGVVTTYVHRLGPPRRGQHPPKLKVTRHSVKVAKTAGCWGTHSTTITVAAGFTFGWRKVEEQGWCGNGSSITWNGGAAYTSYHALAYCYNDVEHNWGWDGSYGWIHGRNYGVLGGSYVWGCASLQTIAPAIRIAASGYWDHYNDF